MSRLQVRFLGHDVTMQTSPFVHGVIDGFLPAARYERLAATFVEPGVSAEGDAYADGKRRIHFPAPPVPAFLASNEPLARFVAEISAPSALAEMRDVCRRASEVPADLPHYDRLAANRLAIDPVAFGLYCEFSSLSRGAVLRPHTDATFKFLSCVYYFAPESWRPEWGGGTEVYRATGDRGRFNWANRELAPEDVEIASLCEFRPNRLFFFVKGRESLHGVAPLASPSDVVRRSFNFALEVPRAAYEASPAGEADRIVQESEAHRLRPSLGGRVAGRALRILRGVR